MLGSRLYTGDDVGVLEVRRLRTFWGFTPLQAADWMGVHETTWRRWERGERIPQMRYRALIADALNKLGERSMM